MVVCVMSLSTPFVVVVCFLAHQIKSNRIVVELGEESIFFPSSMVFFAFTLVMKPRNRHYSKQALKEICLAVGNAGGLIRKLSNEGIIRPYNRRRDSDNTVLTYARYVSLQVDMGEEEMKKFDKVIRDHPDVYVALRLHNLERPAGLKGQPGFFPLDTFVRQEEEIHWPPQASADLYEQLDMNWKEFSRTRWSNFLRN